MKLMISNLVCPCCTIYVKGLLQKLKVTDATVSNSEIIFATHPSEAELIELESGLNIAGLKILRARRNMLVERMKVIFRDVQDNVHDAAKVNLSDHLATKMPYNYSYLSALFSETEGTTIREYCICQRIERVKQMLTVDQLQLDEISYQLSYSSVAHLAKQFKKVTGMTTSEYKRLVTERDFMPLLAS